MTPGFIADTGWSVEPPQEVDRANQRCRLTLAERTAVSNSPDLQSEQREASVAPSEKRGTPSAEAAPPPADEGKLRRLTEAPAGLASHRYWTSFLGIPEGLDPSRFVALMEQGSALPKPGLGFTVRLWAREAFDSDGVVFVVRDEAPPSAAARWRPPLWRPATRLYFPGGWIELR